MGKIKSYRYPDFGPDIAIKLIKQIIDRLGSIHSPIPAIAAALNLSPKSSGLRKRITDLMQYGLLEGRGSLKATELAQKITLGEGDDKVVGVKEMMDNVPLFKNLYDNLAGQEAPQNISPNLMQLTSCDMVEADKNKDKIRNIYNSFILRIMGIGGTMLPITPSMPQKPGTGTSMTRGFIQGGEEPTYKMGDIKIFMPKTSQGYNLLKKMLTVIEFDIINTEKQPMDDSEEDEEKQN